CNTTGNENYTAASESNILSVSTKFVSTCSLIFDPVSGQTYPVSVNASCSCTNPEASAVLYKNGTNVTSENNQFVSLAAGTYDYVCNVTETDNYTSASNSSTYVINKFATIVNLSLNGAEDNLTVTYPASVTAAYSTNVLTATMYRNGTNVSDENNTPVVLATGTYNYTVINPGNENYSGSSKIFFATIQQNTSICSLTFDPVSPVNYSTQVNVSCGCTNPESAATLYKNGTNVTSENNQFVSLAAGSYQYVCNVTETANYTSALNSS
ncbi:unnamed protein product, partial [marine sediment metagenome]